MEVKCVRLLTRRIELNPTEYYYVCTLRTFLSSRLRERADGLRLVADTALLVVGAGHVASLALRLPQGAGVLPSP